MKSVLLALVCSLHLFSVQAQTHKCGTTLSEEQRAWLKDFQNSPEVYRTTGVEYLIPLQIHIVGTDEGNGYYRLDHLFDQLCLLNEHYDTTDFHFFIKGNINYINDDDAYDHDFSAGSRMMRDHNVNDVVNVYFVDNPADNCGYYSPFRDGVAIAKNCATPEASTWAHEFGHFFSLPHTFDGYDAGNSSTWERVDGSNCSSRGDGFCDTPPDYYPGRWTCPSALLTDPVGDTFRVDGSYFMSYANDACQSRFSNQQRNAMRGNLTSWRTDLLAATPPSKLSVGTVLKTAPADGSTDVKLNYEVFSWDPDPNATAYHISISRISSFSNTVIDTVVSTPYYIAKDKFTPTRKYYWRVKPIHPTNTCAEYGSTFSFYANGGFTDVQENFNDKYWNLYPNPSQGVINLSFAYARDEIASLRISTLDGRVIREDILSLKNGANSAAIELDNMANGLYIIELYTNGTTLKTDKFLLQR